MFAKTQAWKRAAICVMSISLLIGVLGVMQVNGQGGTATISGTVSDSSGGAIAGAKVNATNTGTTIVQSAISDAQGRYTVADLPIGTYDVQATNAGFSTVVHSGVSVTVGAHPVVDFALKVGQTQQTVTVEGQVSQVETQSTSISNLVEPTQMRELPLNGRNFEQLLTLSPGVIQQMGGATFYGTQANYSVAGSRPEGQAFLLDSTDVQDFWEHGTGSGATGTSLGIDAIAEFQTLINTYSAQYGGNGAVVNAVTKSGTNDFHGSGYEFLRNDVLDSRNYFDGSTIPPFRRNQFGATFGGPIKKDKAFFFMNYEGVRQLFGQSATVDVPNANAHNGLVPCALAPSAACVGGLANVGVAPGVASTLALYPLPTTTGPTQLLNSKPLGTGTGELVGTEVANLIANENYGVARFDYNFSPKDSMFMRYGIDKATSIDPFQNPVTPSINVPLWPETDTTSNQYATIEEKRIVSTSVINLIRFSFVRTLETQTVTGSTPPLNFFPGTNRENGEVVVTGMSSIGANILDPSIELQNKFIVADDVIWSHGAHSFTFGMSVTRIQDNTSGPFEVGGVWTFTSLTGFLAGTASQVVGALPNQANATGNLRELLFAPYFQDSWRVWQRLTVNIGLRWEPTVNPSEWHHEMETITIPPFGPFVGNVVPAAFATNPSMRNFDPRIGFAYDPFNDHKTSIRAGFGMFHDVITARTILPGYWLNPPFTLGIQTNPTYPNIFSNPALSPPQQTQGLYYRTNAAPYEMQWNLNVQREVAPGTLLTIGYVGSRGVHLFLVRDVNAQCPVVTTSTTCPDPIGTVVNNAIFAKPTLLSNAPAGTPAPVVGVTLPGTGYNITLNPVQNPQYGNLYEKGPWAVSNYNSLQVSLNHQFTHNVQLQVAYTYSKSLDDGSLTYGLEGSNGQAPQNIENPYGLGAQDYGRSTFDRTNSFRASGLYALPFKENKLVEGWQFSGILTAISGPPFTVVDGFNDAGQTAVNTGQRPNLVSGCSPNPVLGQVSKWYNPSCFTPQAIGTLGDLGRDTLVAPGFTNLDFALVKNTPVPKISEQFAVQFRAEFFDILNHPNFNVPNTSVFARTATSGAVSLSPTSGQITSTAGNEVIGGAQRVIQFGIKLLF
jgi:Carboxypeptidase regulatory-like domain